MGAKPSVNNNNSVSARDYPSVGSQTASSPSGGGGGERAGTAEGGGSVMFSLGQQRNNGGGSSSGSSARQRARSLSNVLNGLTGQPINIPPNHGAFELNSGSSASEADIPVEVPVGRVYAAHSLPVQLISFHGVKCPVCSKFVPPEDVECHLVMCLTKPRIIYNEDTLVENKGECVICFEELIQGDTIARLPCLCIYHKICIDAWFKVNRSCPEHPSD